MKTPLKGVRVLELTAVLSGPAVGSLMGDLGADVIKVEPPDGDPVRAWPPYVRDGQASQYVAFNRSKRGIVLDAKKPSGREAYLRLAQRADVIVDNYRHGVADRLGIGYEAVRAINPRIIYAVITGFGRTGPKAFDGATDQVSQAFSGVMSLNAEPDRAPVRTSTSTSDMGSSLYATIGILAALRERDRTGQGCLVETSLMETHMAFLINHWATLDATGESPKPMGSGTPYLMPYQAYQAKDGFIVIACLTEKMYASLCEVLGRPDLLSDPRFAINDERVKNRAALNAILDGIVVTYGVKDLEAKLMAKGVLVTPVNDLKQVLAEPQVQARGGLAVMHHPTAGDVQVVRVPLRFNDEQAGIYGPSPNLGEHSRAVLHEIGYDDAAIERMVAEGATKV